MNITKRAKLVVGAAAVVGAVGALGGTAFTGTGVTNNAGATQFVGGTVSQTVTGATLASIDYAFGDAPANTAINQATLTFADSATDGKTPTITFSATTPVGFTCTAIEATNHTSTCTPTVGGTSQSGATGIAVTVA